MDRDWDQKTQCQPMFRLNFGTWVPAVPARFSDFGTRLPAVTLLTGTDATFFLRMVDR